jgi:hypothetical protein
MTYLITVFSSMWCSLLELAGAIRMRNALPEGGVSYGRASFRLTSLPDEAANGCACDKGEQQVDAGKQGYSTAVGVHPHLQPEPYEAC